MERERDDEIFLYSERETREKNNNTIKIQNEDPVKHGRGAASRRHDIPIRSNDEYIFIDHEIFAVATADVETN